MEDYFVRKSEVNDIVRIMEIINTGKDFFIKNDIPQWGDGYPNESVIQKDIEDGYSFVLCIGDQIVATTVIAFCEDENYGKIYDGSWISEHEYASIHRIAVDPRNKQSGLASKLVSYAIQRCKERKVNSIRVDTHEKNTPMRAMLTKNGFIRCGVIFLNNSANEPRIAYEMLI